MNSRAALLLTLATALWLGGCSTTREPSLPDLGLPGGPWDGPGGGEIERGMASWYGQQFQGRRTASGEPFDMHALTAAHKTLPFGTRVRVRHLGSGQEVVVRINDRGPFAKGRVIDLSRAAAAAIGLVQSGTAQVVLLRP
ncbi:septal ring lytic transglycosylase RlpA family protein [Hydrogenophaga taeniospiralis]|uniref:septal ring lytic transglycosylase RlpA family protein n=1 Tax=Hydrogenophaga taeniospiralis TaxID=65656 RepID=UPI0039B0B409|nr:septal ring lytic transglycosylase RlpA family protein [Hydrogenophaga taeniospiralis]